VRNEVFKVGLRVLVVEDDPLDAKLMAMSLKSISPCQIVVVNSREAFESELEHLLPDVIIADSNVPSFDGKMARTLALQRCPQVPFIFYSGGDPEVLKSNALSLAAQAWVTKQNLDRLDDVVRRVCGWTAS